MNKLLKPIAGLKCPQCELPQPMTFPNTMTDSESHLPSVACEECGAILRIESRDGVAFFLMAVVLIALIVPFFTVGNISLSSSDIEGLFYWLPPPAVKNSIFYIACTVVIALPTSSRILKVEICR